MTHESAARARCSARRKLAIISKLKREPSVINGWLAQHLAMGVQNSVGNLCGVCRREEEGRCAVAKKLMNMKYER